MRQIIKAGFIATWVLGCGAKPQQEVAEKPSEVTALATKADCLDSSCCPKNLAVLLGTEKSDGLEGDATPRCIAGLAGDDELIAGLAGDFVIGGTGIDKMSGGAGPDRMVGGPGNDLLDGKDGNDALEGGADDDKIEGGNGDDAIGGGSGNDVLSGGAGNDWIEGGAGDDLAKGGAGNDTLFGNAGSDQLFGDAGNDTFLFRGACEIKPGEIIDGGPGVDKVISPLTQAEMVALGATFVSIESFVFKPGGSASSHGVCDLMVDGSMACDCCNADWSGTACSTCERVAYSSELMGSDKCLFGPPALTLRNKAIAPVPPKQERNARRVAESMVWAGAQANFVAVGVITSVTAANSPNGIRTTVHFDVTQVLKGPAVGDIDFHFPGGEAAGKWTYFSERSRTVTPRRMLVNLRVTRNPNTRRYEGTPVDGDSLFPVFDSNIVGSGTFRVLVPDVAQAIKGF